MEVERARRLLDEELARLETDRRQVEADLDEQTGEDSGELAHYDQHEAEAATELAGVEQGFGLRADLDRRIAEVHEAMARLDAGRYGVCERCGRPIDDERLVAVPATRYCREHQAGQPSGLGSL